MLKRIVLYAALLFFAVGFCPTAEAAFSSKEMVAQARSFDHRWVIFEGELIGEILQRGEFVWLNVYDGENAISVWLPQTLAEGVRYKGGYKTTGDQIRVGGIFYRSCVEHGGTLDIHASELVVIKKGGPRAEVLDKRKILVLLLLLGALACLLILHILQNKRRMR